MRFFQARDINAWNQKWKAIGYRFEKYDGIKQKFPELKWNIQKI